MKLLCIVLAALICGSAMAAVDCSTFSTQDTCTDSSCKYTETSKSCVSKCTALTKDTCTQGDNATSCAASTQICKANSETQCSTANNLLKADCEGINAPCEFVEPVVAVCTVMESVKTTCATKGQAECTDKCAYTPEAYKSCKNKSGICVGDTTCNAPQCKKVFTGCLPVLDCSTVADDANMQTNCKAAEGCKYQGTGVGDQSCTTDATACGTDICDSTKCKISDATMNCSVNSSDNTCVSLLEGTCTGDNLCEKDVTPASCGARADLCTPCNATDCDITTAAEESKCNSKACPNDITACGAKCTATPFTCEVKESAKCNAAATTKDQCTGFCTFASKGTCAANPDDGSNAVILTFISLIPLLAMLF